MLEVSFASPTAFAFPFLRTLKIVEPKTTYSGELRRLPRVLMKMPGRSLLRAGFSFARIAIANFVSAPSRLAVTLVMSIRPLRETLTLSNFASLTVRLPAARAEPGSRPAASIATVAVAARRFREVVCMSIRPNPGTARK